MAVAPGGAPRGFAVLCLTSLLGWPQVSLAAYRDPTRFLLVSDAGNGVLAYLPIPSSGVVDGKKLQRLSITNGTLQHPQGLAVDQHQQRLLVADPTAKRVLSFPLQSSGEFLSLGEPTVISEGVACRWLVLDALGNVFFTDEAGSKVYKLSAERMAAGSRNGSVVYQAPAVGGLNFPGGLATDNFHLYWTNKKAGTQSGTVVRAPILPTTSGTASAVPLARNEEKAYGVCLARDQVFFTASERAIYGTHRGNGGLTQVANALANPRGCVWDGDNTIFVADRGHGAVYSFPASPISSDGVVLTKVVDFANAFGIAIFSEAMGLQPARAMVLFLVACFLSTF